MRGMLVAKLLTLKTVNGATVALAAGGAAVAATVLTSQPANTSAATSVGDAAQAAHASAAAADSSAASKASPSPSLPGLCQGYTAMPADARQKALQSPAFAALVTAAAGEDKVADFCQQVQRPGTPQPNNPPTSRPAATTTPPTPPTPSRPGAHPSTSAHP
jgi:hypothetical protein